MNMFVRANTSCAWCGRRRPGGHLTSLLRFFCSSTLFLAFLLAQFLFQLGDYLCDRVAARLSPSNVHVDGTLVLRGSDHETFAGCIAGAVVRWCFCSFSRFILHFIFVLTDALVCVF